jgi:hypothetical protein
VHFMIINRTRTDLTPEQYGELGRLAQAFYEGIPDGVRLHGDWAATDRTRSFSVLEAESAEEIEKIQEPFRPYVDMELVPVEPVTGWGKR